MLMLMLEMCLKEDIGFEVDLLPEILDNIAISGFSRSVDSNLAVLVVSIRQLLQYPPDCLNFPFSLFI